MPTERLCIVGAGGHARVVADAVLAAGIVSCNLLCFADDRPELKGRVLLGAPVIGEIASIVRGMTFHVGIGAGEARERLQRELIAVISKYVSIKAEDIKVQLEKQDDLEVLQVKIELPDGTAVAAR